MEIIQQFSKRLHVLENRIPPPIVAAAFAALMWLGSRYAPGLEQDAPMRIGVALVPLVVGVLVAVSGAVSFRRARTTVNPQRPEAASSLVVSGVFQYSRNPMYLGVALILVAWAALLSSPLALLGVAGFVLYINRFQIAPEEKALASLFGQQFAEYKSRVRRWC